MNDKVEIYCRNNGRKISVERGSTLSEIYAISGTELREKVLCATVNNRTERLDYRVYRPKDVEFLDITNPHGLRTYIRSLCFVLSKAVHDIMPEAELKIEHSISKGYFCQISPPCGENMVQRIKARMQEIIAADIPIEKHEVHTSKAIEIFTQQKADEKVKLLQCCNNLYTTYYSMDGLNDMYPYELVLSTGSLEVFDFVKYSYGYLLIPPSESDPKRPYTVERQDKLLGAFEEQTRFNEIAGLKYIGEMNAAIKEGYAPTMIKVMEALHEKQIARIADDITNRFRLNGNARVVLIAGPSSSGKTTFAKRLSIQMLTNLLIPVSISLDDYFVNRDQTPLDENGEHDYESIHALDLELFNNDLNALLQGKEVSIPTYNFESGTRTYKGNKIKLDPSSILILEGIHALNPELTAHIEERYKYKIYVSALTSISIDTHNWIPTTDNRLLRRIIRDSRYRGSSARETISRWRSVRNGEEKWIFPYQESADAMFNTSLIFELAVISRHATPLLASVPRDAEEYNEASRLMNFLRLFTQIPERDIPPTSLAREFLGGSSFKY